MAPNEPEPAPHKRIFWGRVASFKCAGQGVAFMLRTQHNAWIHATLTLIVVAGGVCFGVSAGEWCWLILAMASVWTAESFNTALELITDIAERGLTLTGGGALLTGLGELIEQRLNIDVTIPREPLLSVVMGLGKILENIDQYKKLFVN